MKCPKLDISEGSDYDRAGLWEGFRILGCGDAHAENIIWKFCNSREAAFV